MLYRVPQCGFGCGLRRQLLNAEFDHLPRQDLPQGIDIVGKRLRAGAMIVRGWGMQGIDTLAAAFGTIGS